MDLFKDAKAYCSRALDDIWTVRYPAGIMSAAVLFLATSDLWANYRHDATVNSNIETIRSHADVDGNGMIDTCEKMRVLLKAFPQADKVLEHWSQNLMRTASMTKTNEDNRDFYSNFVDSEYLNLLDGFPSTGPFPLTRTEREDVLAKVAASYTQANEGSE